MLDITVNNLKKILPETLDRVEILKANSKKKRINTYRDYKFGDIEVKIPPNVFTPGGTSENIFKKIINRELKVKGKKVLVMGAGAGIEGILLPRKRAKEICLTEIHKPSTKFQQEIFRNYISKYVNVDFINSNLFKNKFFLNKSYDLLIFNPPAVSVKVSKDKDVIRNTSVGTKILIDFFTQVRKRELMSSKGKIVFRISNTAELQKIISFILELDFSVKILEKINYSTPYEKITTFIFGVQE